MPGTRRKPTPRTARSRGRKHGEGKTLDEAFEAYAAAKGQQRIYERRGLSLQEAMQEFEGEWLPVEIAVQLHPHNQWVKAFRVSDSA